MPAKPAYNWGRKKEIKGFDVFTRTEEIQVNRMGKTIHIKGHDGTNIDSDTVEANLLFEILKTLKAKR